MSLAKLTFALLNLPANCCSRTHASVLRFLALLKGEALEAQLALA
jgi:hypothetical protein